MIEAFGWRPALAQEFAPFAARGLQAGRVIVQHRGIFLLATEHGELSGEISGRMQHEAGEADYPVVGDWVAIIARPDEHGATIHAILPRRTAFSRKAAGSQARQIVAANVDVAFLVTSMNAEFHPRRLERYVATAWASGARPVIVLTKSDICDNAVSVMFAAEAVAISVPVIAVSAMTGVGLDVLSTHLKPGETCVLVGSSGVGKSSLVNALAGRTQMGTGAIRADDARGRHTTTHRELVLLPGGALVLDTPGMRELGLIDAKAGLTTAFDDIEALASRCRFHDCGHGNEPGCAVQAALENGTLEAARWRNFGKLQRELAHAARKENRLAREAEHKRWTANSKNSRVVQRFKRGF